MIHKHRHVFNTDGFNPKNIKCAIDGCDEEIIYIPPMRRVNDD